MFHFSQKTDSPVDTNPEADGCANLGEKSRIAREALAAAERSSPGAGDEVRAPRCLCSGFRLLKNVFFLVPVFPPLLVVKGFYHYWAYLYFFQGS